MRKLNSSTAFMLALLLLIGSMAVGFATFLNQMNSNYVMLQRGTQPVKHVLNHYKYSQNKKGVIFSLTLLVVSTSLMIMIALPSEDRRVAEAPRQAPQPLRKDREDSSISAVIEPQAEEKPAEPEAPPIAAPPPPQVEKEAASATPPVEIIEHVEEISAELDEVTEGEDDVVYGTGPISDAAIMHFVHKFPDSALKFLFRKQLDGKALTNVEEQIYNEWENRHLTRGKVKGYILTLMDWKEFPKKPLYETWREIRDHIYENID